MFHNDNIYNTMKLKRFSAVNTITVHDNTHNFVTSIWNHVDNIIVRYWLQYDTFLCFILKCYILSELLMF